MQLPNVRGADHGLVLEPGVYVSRIVPGSPASKEMNLNVGDRVLFVSKKSVLFWLYYAPSNLLIPCCPQINDTPIDNVQDAILALSEDIDPIMLTLSRSAGQLQSPINSGSNKSHNLNRSTNTSSNHPAHASESSLKSDKSDQNVISSSSSSRRGEIKSRPTSTGLREIFRVRLPKKKHSSPEEAILATLDSAIASGGVNENNGVNSIGVSTNSGSSHSSRKKRSKNRNSSRNNTDQNNVNKNGTWPRLSRNTACSYTLPKDVSPGSFLCCFYYM